MRSTVSLALFFLVVPVFILSDRAVVLPTVVRETNLFLLGTAAVGLALYHRYRRIPWRVSPDPVLAPAFLLLFVLGIAALRAAYLWDALRGWTLVLLGILTYFVVSRTPATAEDRAQVFRVIAIASLCAVLYALTRRFREPPTPAEIRDFLDSSLMTDEMRRQMLFAMHLGRARALFGNPNHLAAWTNLLATGPLVLLLFDRDRRWRLFGGAVLLLQGWLLFLTASRAGMLSFAVGFTVAAGFWYRLHREWVARSWKPLLRVFAVLILLGGAVFLLAGGPARLHGLLQTRTLETRIVWWRAAAELISSAPLGGFGPRMFPFYFPAVRAIGAPESQYIHNLYLATAFAGGIVAVVSLLWLQVAVFRAAWRLTGGNNTAAGPSAVAGVFAATAYWLHACFDFTTEQAEIALLFWFFLGLLGGDPVPRPAGTETSGDRVLPPRWLGPVSVFVLASIWVLLLAIPWQGVNRLAEGKAALEENPPHILRSDPLFEGARRWIPLASGPWYFQACNRFYAAGDPGRAVPFMRQAVRRNPRMAHYHGTLAEMLWAAGERDEALREVTTAIRLHPAKGDYYLQRSGYRAALGDEWGAGLDRERGEIRKEADSVWIPDLEKLRKRP